MELLKNQRKGYRGQVTSTAKDVQAIWSKRDTEKSDPLELQVIHGKLERLEKQLSKLDAEIAESITDSALLDDKAAKTVQYKESIWDVQTKLSILITKASERNSQNLQTTGPSSAKLATKLPKLTIPQFDGDPLNWQEFWDSYRHAIHENQELSDVERFQHLKAHLTGEAGVVANGYRLTAANYHSVIEVLVDRFGSDELAIFAHFDKLLALPTSSTDTQRLQTTYDETEKHIRSLVSLGLGEEVFGQVFTPTILSKLPRAVRVDLHRRNGSNRWELSTLRSLFREEIRARQMGDWTLDQPAADKRGNKIDTPACSKPAMRAEGQRPKRKQCTAGALSNNSAKVMACSQDFIIMHLLCLCPVKFGGNSKEGLRGGVPSRVSGTKPNASALGLLSDLDPTAATFNPASGVSATTISSIANAAGSNRFVQMQMATVNFHHGVSARLFFDTGSSRSYITSDLANRLQLSASGTEVISNARFEDSRRRTHSYKKVNFSIPCNAGPISMSALVTETIACPITRVPINFARYPALQLLPLADLPPKSPENVSIDILVGSDYYFHIVQSERIDLADGLILLGSKLGYITSGTVLCDNPDLTVEASNVSALLSFDTFSVAHQDFNLERFWTLEDIGIKDDGYAKDDELALRRFNDSIRYVDGRYEVGWPWKSDHPELTDNYDLAVNRLKSLCRRLQADYKVLETYHRSIQQQAQTGIIEKVSDLSSESMVHYLPHHCVIKPDRTTTKLRIVYDASSKSHRSLNSLNDCLLRGPVYLQNLCGLLLRFRTHQFAVTADIEKAFLQVSIKPADRDVTRFLWLRDPFKPPSPDNLVVYRFCRVLFGVVSSAFLLDATIKYFLSQQKCPTASLIADNMYVDNVIAGSSTVDGCSEIYDQGKKLFTENGMNIREWNSNCPQTMDHIPKADRGKQHQPKVLGLFWDTQSDMLTCPAVKFHADDVKTKRHLLQAVSKVFDPCGFLSPVVVQIKLLIQELWVRKMKWDDLLPPDIIDRWSALSKNIQSIHQVRISRFIGFSGTGNWLIHCFCDASGKAYTAVVYLQAESPGAVPVLVFSKARLAPIKPVSMPRLELMAVVVGVRITKFITDHMALSFSSVTIWSDSTCVLRWIQSNKVLSVFVENRIRELRSCDYTFRYVCSELNPADVSSRGCTFPDLMNSLLWWNGPQFLQMSEEFWPLYDLDKDAADSREKEHVQTTATVKAANTLPASAFCPIDFLRFSSFLKLLRVTAWVLRFSSRILSRIRPNLRPVAIGHLSSAELGTAEGLLMRLVQNEAFSPVAMAHAKGRSLWAQLNVFVDDVGILRCAGRIQSADLPPEAKFPILLPKRHRLTDLVISDLHCKHMHVGVNHTLSLVRQRFWVPCGRSVVASVIRHCPVCRRHGGGPFPVPKFPPLPEFRLTAHDPFSSIGVDYFGPLFVKQDAVSTKVWICLFTCASSRAIHLEVVTDMTTEQFILALRRFTAAWGPPDIIVSDNAKQFKLARSFLDRLWSNMISSTPVQDFAASKGIQFIFLPEYAPWMGGFYERLVGTVKHSLRRVLGRQTLGLVQLQTVIAEVATVVNSRPLVAASGISEPALTPAHLLGRRRSLPGNQGKPNVLTLDPIEDTDTLFRIKPSSTDQLIATWQATKRHLNQFWDIWKSVYLTSLREMKSGFKIRNLSDIEPTVGQVVIVKSSTPRSVWNLALITKLHMSDDGNYRSATLRLPNGKSVIRPIKLLYPLESSVADISNPPQQAHEQSDKPGDRIRKTRKSAQQAKLRIQHQLQDTEDMTMITSVNLSCLISGASSKMPDVNETVLRDSPLSRLYSKHRFFIGEQLVTSIEMGAWYVVLLYHGFTEIAHELVNHPGLLNDAVGISPWIEQVGFRQSADVNCILQIDRFYYAVAYLLLESEGNALLRRFEDYRRRHGNQRVSFVVCSRHEYIWSCGLSEGHRSIDDKDAWPGFNIFGELLSSLYTNWVFGEAADNPTVDEILHDHQYFGSQFQQAALILSDSFSRHVLSLEFSSVVRRTGATFSTLARSVNSHVLNRNKYVIIVAGANMTAATWDEQKWEADWARLFRSLRPIIHETSKTRILINGPVWHTSRKAAKVAQFSRWTARAVEGFNNIFFFDWPSPIDNPFVIHGANRNPRPDRTYFDRDRYHINSKGFLLFWRRWCYTCTGQQLLSLRQSGAIWQPMNGPHRRHTSNRSIHA